MCWEKIFWSRLLACLWINYFDIYDCESGRKHIPSLPHYRNSGWEARTICLFPQGWVEGLVTLKTSLCVRSTEKYYIFLQKEQQWKGLFVCFVCLLSSLEEGAKNFTLSDYYISKVGSLYPFTKAGNWGPRCQIISMVTDCYVDELGIDPKYRWHSYTDRTSCMIWWAQCKIKMWIPLFKNG